MPRVLVLSLCPTPSTTDGVATIPTVGSIPGPPPSNRSMVTCCKLSFSIYIFLKSLTDQPLNTLPGQNKTCHLDLTKQMGTNLLQLVRSRFSNRMRSKNEVRQCLQFVYYSDSSTLTFFSIGLCCEKFPGQADVLCGLLPKHKQAFLSK